MLPWQQQLRGFGCFSDGILLLGVLSRVGLLFSHQCHCGHYALEGDGLPQPRSTVVQTSVSELLASAPSSLREEEGVLPIPSHVEVGQLNCTLRCARFSPLALKGAEH